MKQKLITTIVLIGLLASCKQPIEEIEPNKISFCIENISNKVVEGKYVYSDVGIDNDTISFKLFPNETLKHSFAGEIDGNYVHYKNIRYTLSVNGGKYSPYQYYTVYSNSNTCFEIKD